MSFMAKSSFSFDESHAIEFSLLGDPYLRDEVNDFHEDVQWNVFRRQSFEALRKQTVHNTGQMLIRGFDIFAFESNHVDPTKSIRRLDEHCRNSSTYQMRRYSDSSDVRASFASPRRLPKHSSMNLFQCVKNTGR